VPFPPLLYWYLILPWFFCYDCLVFAYVFLISPSFSPTPDICRLPLALLISHFPLDLWFSGAETPQVIGWASSSWSYRGFEKLRKHKGKVELMRTTTMIIIICVSGHFYGRYCSLALLAIRLFLQPVCLLFVCLFVSYTYSYTSVDPDTDIQLRTCPKKETPPSLHPPLGGLMPRADPWWWSRWT
jgi:hypothetical protein